MSVNIDKVRWGVLSTANIAEQWLIPAIHQAENAELVAVASRDKHKAEDFAKRNAIPVAYGSYEALLNDPNIDAIYNPMPNHLHVPWSIRAIEAGKHVLCEKPLGIDLADAEKLVQVAQNSDRVVMEAFMYRFHPQWRKIKELIDSGVLGKIRHVQSSFCFFNRDANNVRNMPGIGGGGLLDIGSYCISVSRLAFGKVPRRVSGLLDIDSDFKVDVHASAILDFGDGMATFNCSMQSNSTQFVHIVGDHGRIFVDTPFHKREDKPCELVLYRNQDKETIVIGHHNHFVYEVEAFSKAIQEGKQAPTPLSDAIENMRVIDAVFKSAETGNWVEVSS